MIRDNLKIQVERRPDSDEADPSEVDKIMNLVDRYRRLVFDDNKVGCIRTKHIHLDYEEKFKPKLRPFRNVPINYQGEVSKPLEFLRTQGVITDMDTKKMSSYTKEKQKGQNG